MKKTLTLLVFALFIFGCSDDDPAPDPASLIGTWTITNEVYSGCNDPADNRTDPCDDCDDLIFSATTVTVGIEVYTYSTSGNTLTVTLGSDTLVITYSVSATTLTFTIQESDVNGGCKIVSTYTRI